MFEKLGSYLLILTTILLVLNEQLLTDKLPISFFANCKLLLKTLSVRAKYGESRSFSNFLVLLSACFCKRLVFDLLYSQFSFEKYLQPLATLVITDLILFPLAKKGFTAESLLKIDSLKTFLTLASGVSDSFGLESLLAKNKIASLHAVVAFLFVSLDPVLFSVATWLIKGEKKEKNMKNCVRGLTFGLVVAFIHMIGSRGGYNTLTYLRRNTTSFSASVTISSSKTIRLLNNFAYIALLVCDIVSTSSISSVKVSTNQAHQDIFVKPFTPRTGRRISDASTASNLSELQADWDDDFHALEFTKFKLE